MENGTTRRVLIPTDFSENSKNAARYALKLFDHRDDVEFVVLNAYDVPHGGSNTMLVSITDILKKDSEQGLKETMKDLAPYLDGANVKTRSIHGGLQAVIEELLEKEEFHLIVMGTLGAGGLKKVLLGSNTSDVVSNIHRPVLIVPNGVEYSKPERMLLTTDFKPTQRTLQMERLLDFVKRVESELMVLNIHDEQKKVNLDTAKIESGLHDLLQGVNHSYHERVNKDIIEGIDDFVKEKNVGIVSMIVRKLSFFANLFHKSLTKEMAMHTKVPMLVLHD